MTQGRSNDDLLTVDLARELVRRMDRDPEYVYHILTEVRDARIAAEARAVAAEAEAARLREDRDEQEAWRDENARQAERLMAERDEARTELASAQVKIAALRSEETVERVARAVYELNRDPEYSGEEWDWPNIDRSYDYDDDGEPSPEWLRDRFRADVRFVLAAASGVAPDKPTICEHSGMTVQRCKDIDLCDCFDQPNGDKR